jgi:hypothetical protein
MVSIEAFGKLVVEPKTLGWENSKEILKMLFENLGVVFYSTEMFSEMDLYKWSWKGEKGVGGFIKRHWWFFVVARYN